MQMQSYSQQYGPIGVCLKPGYVPISLVKHGDFCMDFQGCPMFRQTPVRKGGPSKTSARLPDALDLPVAGAECGHQMAPVPQTHGKMGLK